MLVLGIEGSANKIGVGIVSDEGVILSNPRHTYEPSNGLKYKNKPTLSPGLKIIAPKYLHFTDRHGLLRADSACLADTSPLLDRASYRKRQLCTIRQDTLEDLANQ